MNIFSRHRKASIVASILAVIFLVLSLVFIHSGVTYAGSDDGNGRLMTIHDRGLEKVVLSHGDTVREALDEAGIPIDEKDSVEPSLDEKLVASNYQVNIYRARPVLIIDGKIRKKIMTAYQTPEQIASSAKITIYPEDNADVDRVDDLSMGVGLQLSIDRATPFNFTLYGKNALVRTQGETVGQMLSEKGIKLGRKDKVTPALGTKITKGLKVKVWREGKQTITTDEAVDFEVTMIQDADREVGYRQVVTPGKNGLRSVTYEIIVRDGKEVSRKEIASLVLKQPTKQVEIVGAKPSFSGNFAQALAKLRSCEGGYSSWNPAGPYYGAYQFDRQTWGTVADPSKYGSASPAEQDQAAYNLYLRRGWSPWPVCGASLPDVYR